MFIPESSTLALWLIVLSMLCWGSWPNLLKALPGWRLEYFYVDYTIGFLLGVLALSATAGSLGPGAGFIDRVTSAGTTEMLLALTGGFVWNVGNILLLNAIMVAGLAVAFPIASVLAITLGVGISYATQPIGNPYWLLAGTVVLVVAAWFNALAYRDRSGSAESGRALGIGLSLGAGLLVGIFPPFIARAIGGAHGLDPYSVSFFFMAGAAVATAIGVVLLLKRPFIGEPGRLSGYFGRGVASHLMGMAAGVIWCLGTVANFASAGVVGMAVSWGIGSGAPMVGALWGILLWKEFRGAGRAAIKLITVSLVLYAAGVTLVAIAYELR